MPLTLKITTYVLVSTSSLPQDWASFSMPLIIILSVVVVLGLCGLLAGVLSLGGWHQEHIRQQNSSRPRIPNSLHSGQQIPFASPHLILLPSDQSEEANLTSKLFKVLLSGLGHTLSKRLQGLELSPLTIHLGGVELLDLSGKSAQVMINGELNGKSLHLRLANLQNPDFADGHHLENDKSEGNEAHSFSPSSDWKHKSFAPSSPLSVVDQYRSVLTQAEESKNAHHFKDDWKINAFPLDVLEGLTISLGPLYAPLVGVSVYGWLNRLHHPPSAPPQLLKHWYHQLGKLIEDSRTTQPGLFHEVSIARAWCGLKLIESHIAMPCLGSSAVSDLLSETISTYSRLLMVEKPLEQRVHSLLSPVRKSRPEVQLHLRTNFALVVDYWLSMLETKNASSGASNNGFATDQLVRSAHGYLSQVEQYYQQQGLSVALMQIQPLLARFEIFAASHKILFQNPEKILYQRGEKIDLLSRQLKIEEDGSAQTLLLAAGCLARGSLFLGLAKGADTTKDTTPSNKHHTDHSMWDETKIKAENKTVSHALIAGETVLLEGLELNISQQDPGLYRALQIRLAELYIQMHRHGLQPDKLVLAKGLLQTVLFYDRGLKETQRIKIFSRLAEIKSLGDAGKKQTDLEQKNRNKQISDNGAFPRPYSASDITSSLADLDISRMELPQIKQGLSLIEAEISATHDPLTLADLLVKRGQLMVQLSEQFGRHDELKPAKTAFEKALMIYQQHGVNEKACHCRQWLKDLEAASIAYSVHSLLPLKEDRKSAIQKSAVTSASEVNTPVDHHLKSPCENERGAKQVADLGMEGDPQDLPRILRRGRN